MPKLKVSNEDYLKAWEKYGSVSVVADVLGMTERNSALRRRAVERWLGRRLEARLKQGGKLAVSSGTPSMRELAIDNGFVIVGSDAHYYPGIVTTAHRAFVQFVRELKPVAVVMNGDVFDGAMISRHPRIGWDNKPTVIQELDAVHERLDEIEAVAPKTLIWTLGNHDARYETFLASHAPDYQGIKGFHLKDHFPMWLPCWGLRINGNVVVKHRGNHTGVHAIYNNTLRSGVTLVTGHLHALNVRRYSDYNGHRWGVDTGTLAVPYGPQFIDYTEANPVDWASGFAVLRFKDGELLWPTIVNVMDEESGKICWGAETFTV